MMQQLCAQILQKVHLEENNIQVHPLQWDTRPLKACMEIPQVHSVKLMHHLQTLQQLQKSILSYTTKMHKDIPAPLAWINTMQQPVLIPDSLQQPYVQHLKIWQDIHGDMDMLQAAWGVYQNTPEFDKNFSGYLASLWNPTCTVYEKEILNNFLRLNKNNQQYTLEQLENDMQSYQPQELTHQLLITAQYTHIPSLWMFKDKKFNLQACFKNLNQAQDWDAVHKIIQLLVKEDKHNTLAEILNRVQFYCSTNYKCDTSKINGDLSSFITHCTAFVETNIPKFLLTPSLSVYCKETWGYPGLSLKFDEKTRILSIKSESFQKIAPINEQIKPLLPVYPDFLHLGEVMFQPEMMALTQHAQHITRFLKLKVNSFTGSESFAACSISDLKKLVESDIAVCIKQLQTKFDQTTQTNCFKLAQPISFVAWKLDLPKKQLINSGQIPPHHCFSNPCKMQRKVGVDNVELAKVGNIKMVHANTGSTRNTVCQTIQMVFPDIINQLPVTPNHPTYTTLHESIACFTLYEPLLHNIISLHASIPWTNSYQDTRYAETQLACNESARYRDWCCFMAGKACGRQKSKLDSHVITSDKIYQSYFPMLQESSTKWLNVCSSLPIQNTILQHKYNKNATQLENLQQALTDHINSQTLVLPSRTDAAILPSDMHVYTDHDSQTVMMVYASPEDPDKHLDFTAFQIKNNK